MIGVKNARYANDFKEKQEMNVLVSCCKNGVNDVAINS